MLPDSKWKAIASSVHDSYVPRLVFDGRISTFYHSSGPDWHASEQWIMVDFAHVVQVEFFGKELMSRMLSPTKSSDLYERSPQAGDRTFMLSPIGEPVLLEVAGNWAQWNFILSGLPKRDKKIE